MKKFAILIDNNKDIFTNGIIQQIYFTYLTLQKCDLDVILIANSGESFFSFLKIPVRIIKTIDKENFKDIHTILFLSSSFTQKFVLDFI